MEFIKNVIRGITIGIANVVPGAVSYTHLGVYRLVIQKGDVCRIVCEKLAENGDVSKRQYLVNKLMMTNEPDDQPFGEMELSALKEIGNIIAGSYLSALSSLTNLVITPSVPYIAVDMAASIDVYKRQALVCGAMRRSRL